MDNLTNAILEKANEVIKDNGFKTLKVLTKPTRAIQFLVTPDFTLSYFGKNYYAFAYGTAYKLVK